MSNFLSHRHLPPWTMVVNPISHHCQSWTCLARNHTPYTSSADRMWTFLCMEIGAGHQELCALLDVLAPTLRSFCQKEYYEQPHSHASFAWFLLDRPSQRSPAQALEDSEPLPIATPLEVPARENTDSFPTIQHLSENIIPTLNTELGSQLKGTAGTFDVGENSCAVSEHLNMIYLQERAVTVPTGINHRATSANHRHSAMSCLQIPQSPLDIAVSDTLCDINVRSLVLS